MICETAEANNLDTLLQFQICTNPAFVMIYLQIEMELCRTERILFGGGGQGRESQYKTKAKKFHQPNMISSTKHNCI